MRRKLSQWGSIRRNKKNEWPKIGMLQLLDSSLRDTQRKYQEIFNSVHDAIFVETLDGRIAEVNPAACALLGYTREELLALNVTDILPPEVAVSVSDILQREAETEGKSFIGDNIRRDGSTVPVEVRTRLIELDGEPVLVVVARDISERNKIEKLLRQVAQGVSADTGVAFFRILAEHLANTFQVSHVIIGQLDDNVRDKITTLACYANDEQQGEVSYHLAGTPCEHVVSGKMYCCPSGVREAFPEDHLLREMGVDSYIGVPLKDSAGKTLGLMAALDASAMKNPELVGSVFRIFASRASAEMERIHREKRMHHLAFHDHLTGLPNRRKFYDGLAMDLRQNQLTGDELALMCLDLDLFKRVNDTQGHAMGDQLLKDIALRLQRIVADQGVVARIGGDEFAIILPNITGIEHVHRMAAEIIECLQQPWVHDVREFYITTSIGITIAPDDGADPDMLLKNADVAMYHAKEQGGNNYQFYTNTLNDTAMEKVAMENKLCHALLNQEFVLYYQPKVSTTTGIIVGMEALVRWCHPEQGLISPDKFIPLAEETGLIIPMGEWILRTACIQNKQWQDQGYPPMRIAVNISPRQLQQRDFVMMVEKVLSDTGLDPCWLELEVTESVAMFDLESTLKKLHELQQLGIHIAMDDFGTGYSSLSYLKRFPINTLKVAQDFVRDLSTDANDAALATAIIAMGHSLNLELVAEGVETEAQFAFLKKLHCHIMQGYLFGRPMPAGDFENLLKI